MVFSSFGTAHEYTLKTKKHKLVPNHTLNTLWDLDATFQVNHYIVKYVINFIELKTLIQNNQQTKG